METYVTVSFWFGLIVIILNTIEMAVRDWPKKREITLGEFVGTTILTALFTIWAGIVKWMR